MNDDATPGTLVQHLWDGEEGKTLLSVCGERYFAVDPEQRCEICDACHLGFRLIYAAGEAPP